MKTCSKCGEAKPVEAFYATSGNRCKPCHNRETRRRAIANPERTAQVRNRWRARPDIKARELANGSRWRKRNPETVRVVQFMHNLKRNYGLTIDQYHAMQERQDFQCRICGADDRGNLHVDHDHVTQTVRGLLCNQCNTAIGLFQESAAVMRRAADYVSA